MHNTLLRGVDGRSFDRLAIGHVAPFLDEFKLTLSILCWKSRKMDTKVAYRIDVEGAPL